MTWTIQYVQDTEVDGVGTATATYDEAGIVLASHSGRIAESAGDTLDEFIVAAIGKLALARKNADKSAAMAAKLQTVLDAKTG